MDYIIIVLQSFKNDFFKSIEKMQILRWMIKPLDSLIHGLENIYTDWASCY